MSVQSIKVPPIQVIVDGPDVPAQVPQSQPHAVSHLRSGLKLEMGAIRRYQEEQGPGSPGSGTGNSARSPDRLLTSPRGSPRHLEVPAQPQPAPATPRTRELDSVLNGMNRKLENSRSPFERWKIRCAKAIFTCFPSCIMKTIVCSFPPQPACCCAVEKVLLFKLKDKIKTANNCACCCAAIPCCIQCICTLGCSLRQETFCCPEDTAVVTPVVP